MGKCQVILQIGVLRLGETAIHLGEKKYTFGQRKIHTFGRKKDSSR